MYGCYIKGRGWIKTILNGNKFKCCRNASDVYANFLFNNEAEYKTIVGFYADTFAKYVVEFREISEDQLNDKRVVPCKKGGWSSDKKFILQEKGSSYYNKYCSFCRLFIDGREYVADGVCIHCMEEFRNALKPHYDAMDDDIKEAWARAKILDEI